MNEITYREQERIRWEEWEQGAKQQVVGGAGGGEETIF